MATRAKKNQRRQQRKRANALLAKLPGELHILEASEATTVALEAAEGEGDAPRVRSFKMLAYTGGAMNVRGFYYPVVVDLEGLTVTARSRPILRNHELGRIVGHTEQIQVTGNTIRVAGKLSAANDEVAEITASADNGFPWRASIGASPDRVAFVDDGEKVTVNGKNFTGPIIVIRQSRLNEVSFVALGADDNSSVSVAAQMRQQENEMNFAQWLEANGFDPEDQLSAKQVAVLKAQFEAEQVEADDDPPAKLPVRAAQDDDENDPQKALQARREAFALEAERCDAIREICARYADVKTIKLQGKDVSLQATAIREGWTAEKVELTALRESRPKAPAAHSRNHDGDCTLQALEGAMILRAGGTLDSKTYGDSVQARALLPSWLRAGINDENRQRFMEAAHRFDDMSMVDLCIEAIRLDGHSDPGGRSSRIQAAISGSTLTKIFTTSVNARLLASFMEAPDTTGPWTQERDVADFKQYENIRLQTGPGLAKHPRGGTADHTDRSDQQETNKIARYSRQFFADEQDFIDDSFNALADTPVQMGQAARRLRPDLCYAILLANGNLATTGRQLFNSTEANLKTSSTFGDTELRVGIALMLLVQENGVNLNLPPTHLLVPPSLLHLARELLNSGTLLLASGTDATIVRGSSNPLVADAITPVSDARLENGVTDPATGTTYAGAADDWYLANNRVPTIEVAYLRGTGRAPSVTSWRKNGEDGKWGIGWSVKMDVGAAAQEWRGLRKHEA